MSLRPKFDMTICTPQDPRDFTNAWHDLRAMAQDLAAMPDEWVRALDAWQRPAPTTAGQNGGRHQIGSISDTTASAALGNLGALAAARTTAAEILLLRHTVLTIRQRLANIRVEADAVTLAQAVDAARCSGMKLPGYMAWGDETCTELATHDSDGLCSKCRPHRAAWVADPTYRRPVDRRRGARLPVLEGLGERAGVDNLRTRLNRVEIEGAA